MCMISTITMGSKWWCGGGGGGGGGVGGGGDDGRDQDIKYNIV